MPETSELFGVSRDGEPLVSLDNAPNEPRRDIVLPRCYRNTPWALATAHAVGIGVYREGGLLQHPDNPRVWQDIGYSVVRGELELGSRVTLKRSIDSYPEYFPQLIDPDDAVVLQVFDDEQSQDAWVAEQIARNLREDELEADDILIVLPETYRAKRRAPQLIRALLRYEIPGHLVGVGSSVDEVFRPGSVAIAHIYRAKGNEAPMVYAVDAQYGAHEFNAVTRRNTLFTAITRSRAWVRVTGWGERAAAVGEEIRKVREHDFQLEVPIPTEARLVELRHIHRERPAEAEAVIKRITDELNAFLEAVERGDLDIGDLPPAVRERLLARLDLDGDRDD